jgi:hypothetical protein
VLAVATVMTLLAAGAGSCARTSAAPRAGAVPAAPTLRTPSDYWDAAPHPPSAPTAVRCFAAPVPPRGVPAVPSSLWLAAGAGVAVTGQQPSLDAFAGGHPRGCRSVWPDG